MRWGEIGALQGPSNGANLNALHGKGVIGSCRCEIGLAQYQTYHTVLGFDLSASDFSVFTVSSIF